MVPINPHRSSQLVRVGVLDLLAHLSLHHGRSLGSAAPESLAIASRTAGRSSHAVVVRAGALRLAACAVEGMSPTDRSAAAVQGEAWKLFERNAKVRLCVYGMCMSPALLQPWFVKAVRLGGP